MSFEALTWAVKQNTANAGQKLVLMMLANYTNPDTGQCNPSQKRLAEKCCMSLASVKRHIETLEQSGFLSVVNNYRNNSLVACQYELHLSSNCINPQLNLSQPLAQSELQKHKEETRIETTKSKELFEMFWKAYPRKVGPTFAKKSFEKLKVNEELLRKMLFAIEQQKRSVWKDKDPQYIPHPSTWLNQGRWEDEVTVAQKTYTGLESAI